MKTSSPIIRLSLLITFALCLFSVGFSQTDTLSYFIETNDGNIYQGKIIEKNDIIIKLSTSNIGVISIQQNDIKKIHSIDNKKLKKGKYWKDNPQSTRYFFSPNGFGLKSGEGYYQNVWVLINSATIGVSDYFSLGLGMMPNFLFGGAPTPIWMTAKASIPVSKENLSFGIGALGGTVIGEKDTEFAILYGITTVGNKDNNISFGLGYGYAGDSWAKSPMINVNFMFRTGPKGYIISENYYLRTGSYNNVLLSFGGRVIIKNAGLDYGLVIPIFGDMESLFAIPWLGITIPFGINKN